MIKYLANLTLLYVEDNINILKNNQKTFEILFKKVYVSSSYNNTMKIFRETSIDLLIVDIASFIDSFGKTHKFFKIVKSLIKNFLFFIILNF